MAKKLAFDKVLFTTVVLLVGLGLVMVYSASAVVGGETRYGLNRLFLKQILAIGLGALAMLAVMHVDYRNYKRSVIVYGLLALTVTLLVVVLFSPPINGTRRWILVGGFSFCLINPIVFKCACIACVRVSSVKISGAQSSGSLRS